MVSPVIASRPRLQGRWGEAAGVVRHGRGPGGAAGRPPGPDL